MAKENFCCPEKFSVVIPYSDFVKLVETGKKVDQISKDYKILVDQVQALRCMYTEAIEKIGEIERYL